MTPRILIVDDEAPARQRLADLLADLAGEFPHQLIGAASDGLEALAIFAQTPAEIVLTDIRMPRMDGLELAQQLAACVEPPALVFVTAYDDYALAAFDLAAVDYLVKPVTQARLLQALLRARRLTGADFRSLAPQGRSRLRVVERGEVHLVPVAEILYLRAEDKYVVAHTAHRDYLLDESLSRLEEEFRERFVRIHRACLVAREAVAGAVRAHEGEHEGHWLLVLRDGSERLPVSRRQWPLVKTKLGL